MLRKTDIERGRESEGEKGERERARVCMPYGDGTAGEKTVQLLAGQP